ncbi:terminase-like family protein [Vibrio phage 1.193.O._10N.286.52.C6]|nr:terminase-like family protein [Vibrio phage 1.193.O._10N.286.52.C6]
MPDHEIRTMIDWYLDEKGYPDPKKDGVRRFFYRLDGEYIWANSMEELGEMVGMPEEEWEDNFFSFAFVSGTIYDKYLSL